MFGHKSIAGVLTATVLGLAGGAQAAAIQTLVTDCTPSGPSESFTEAGDWSRTASGSGTSNTFNICSSGRGSFGGSATGVSSQAVADANATQVSVTDQSILGARTLSTYEFMIISDGNYSGGPVQFTLNAQLTGSYDVTSAFSGLGGGAVGVGIIGGNMFVGDINSQKGWQQSWRASSDRFDTSAAETGTVDEQLSITRLIMPDTVFDVRMVSYAFSSVSARYNLGSTSAEASANTSAFLAFTSFSLPDGFCVKSDGGGINSCQPDMPSVPLPASALLLFGGLFGLMGLRRFS